MRTQRLRSPDGRSRVGTVQSPVAVPVEHPEPLRVHHHDSSPDSGPRTGRSPQRSRRRGVNGVDVHGTRRRVRICRPAGRQASGEVGPVLASVADEYSRRTSRPAPTAGLTPERPRERFREPPWEPAPAGAPARAAALAGARRCLWRESGVRGRRRQRASPRRRGAGPRRAPTRRSGQGGARACHRPPPEGVPGVRGHRPSLPGRLAAMAAPTPGAPGMGRADGAGVLGAGARGHGRPPSCDHKVGMTQAVRGGVCAGTHRAAARGRSGVPLRLGASE